MKKHSKNLIEFQDFWKEVLRKIPNEILKRLGNATEQFSCDLSCGALAHMQT